MSRIALRVVCHLVAEVPVLVIAAIQISKGWLPTSDDAVIAWRTWSVFSGPVPLDGQFSQISNAGHHAAFDLGPLQYFLLAVPVRIDPLHGILWGSALVIAILIALSIEAVWSVAGAVGGTLTAAGLALMTATLVQSSVNLAWNPSMGAYAFAATMATSFAVARGRFAWLPVALGTASLATQCHTSFVIPCLAVLVVGLGLGLAERRRIPWRPAVIGAGVVLACFAAPIGEQLTGHPGNWTVVLSSIRHLGPKVGLQAGLRGVAAATHLPPSWWLRVPPVTTVPQFQHFEQVIYAGSEAWGIAVLALAAAIAVGGYLLGRRRLAALAAIAAAGGLATAVTLGSVPDSQAPYLVYYLYFALWPVGMALLLTIGLGIAVAVAEGAQRLGSLRAGTAAGPATGARVVGLALAAVVVATAGGLLVWNDAAYGSSDLFLMGWKPIETVSALTAPALRIVRSHEPATGPRRPFAVVAEGPLPFIDNDIAVSLAYELAARGEPARVTGAADRPLGPGYASDPGDARLVLTPRLHGGYAISWQSGTRSAHGG